MLKKLASVLALSASLASSAIAATNCSGSITLGGTAQVAIAVPTVFAVIHGYSICNVDNTHGPEVLWFSPVGTAVAAAAGSYPLNYPTAVTYANPGCYTTPDTWSSNGAVSVLAATTAHVYTCWWW